MRTIHSSALLLVLSMMASTRCLAQDSALGAFAYLEELPASYELVSIGGRMLPATESGVTYFAGRLILNADYSYTSTISAEGCVQNTVCTRRAATLRGAWAVLPDGTLSLREEGERESQAKEVPRIEADGKEIIFRTPGTNAPSFFYVRM